MSKKITVIVILALVFFTGTLFVLFRPKYVFDFEGRVKLLEQMEKTQKDYPNATILIPDDKRKLPKTVPLELTYPGAKLASVEQLSSRGISYVHLSSDSKVQIAKTMSVALQNEGWELIANAEDTIEAKKGVQKTKISFETEEDHIVITVAYTYDL